jgi:hypothetical protein
MPPTMPPAIAPVRELWEGVEEAEVKPVGTMEPAELVEETWAGVVEEIWTGTMTAAELGRGQQMVGGRKGRKEGRN